ncbi:MAG: CrcB family protein [Alicyclobacillaceae bacterium]|jgi:CrcB protein|uniref:fluoride efflux transporter FluC n=1 Tax=Alicyclobacillus sp. SP_1 TaxID=2942475 RepID=UPI00215860CF|nr:CrcB family protein [Alicyclobacillus sp. SP_1]MCY0888251.1 CrcB family protein [Alicyclobacillaceae bacterium]MCY0894826.1 CrcB family protein [Alicyclobacillaceae bacterium]
MSSVALVCVAAGAIVGTMARFWIGRSFESLGQAQFPWATWIINAIGSFFIGIFAEQLLLHHFSVDIWDLLGEGFCGGLTTFSTMSVETVRLLKQSVRLGLTYIGTSLASGVVFCSIGLFLLRP